MGSVFTVQGNEKADLRSRDANGEEVGIIAGGVGGLGIHRAPGEAAPRTAMYLDAGADLAHKTAGGEPRGIGIRLNGDMLQDPNRNINHLERDMDIGLVGGQNGLY